MAKLKRSPFKANMIENDPNAFGLRVKEIVGCAETLFNDRSILISGPRGIGKSSLGNQLQKILEGNTTLLERCGIDATFPETLCIFYACDQGTTLDQLALDILYNVEQKCQMLPSLQSVDIKPSLEVNLGVIKTKLEMGSKVEKRSPATIASQIVAGLATTLDILRKAGTYESINIMLDELDQISNDVNFGHFMKIIHENLVSRELQQITFIFAGQQGIYTRLINEDPSFERIVRHVPLSTLDEDASEYVLSYAASKAKPPFQYSQKARDFILALSSGYPYVLHLLGDAAFLSMENNERMSHADVMNGLESVLKSDKREKYFDRMKELSENERRVVIALSEYSPNSIPAEIPISWLSEWISSVIPSEDVLSEVLESLVQKGHLVILKNKVSCRFSEELFRVFIALSRIEQTEIKLRKSEKLERRKLEKNDDALLIDLLSRNNDVWPYLDEEDRNESIRRMRIILNKAEYNTDWDDEDLFSLD